MDFLMNVARRQLEPGSGIRPRSPSRFAPMGGPAGDTPDLIELSTETVAPRPRPSQLAMEGAPAARPPSVVAPQIPAPVSSQKDSPEAGPSDRGSLGAASEREGAPVIVETVARPEVVAWQPSPDVPDRSVTSLEAVGSRRPARERSDAFDHGARRPLPDPAPPTPEAQHPDASHPPLVKVDQTSPPDWSLVTQATQSVERVGRPEADSPIVTVTIGRVEVRAVTGPAPTLTSAPARPAAARTLSLEDYLERRHGAAQR